MLNIHLSKVIDYAGKYEHQMPRAVEEFFGDIDVDVEMLEPEIANRVTALFNEWLIFEFKLDSGTTIIADYYLRNPDHLGEKLLKELEQIIKTQRVEILEIISKQPGEWLRAEGLHSGKRYKIYDVLLSQSIPDYGSFTARLAEVDQRWYSVGTDPNFFPISYTERAKKFQRDQGGDLSAKDFLPLLLPNPAREQTEKVLQVTDKEIKAKRKKIRSKYEKLARKYGLKVTFPQLVEFVFEENYQSHFADWLEDVMELGIPEEVFVENIQLFNDLWNYFPHEKLDGKCPAEKFREVYGEKRGE